MLEMREQRTPAGVKYVVLPRRSQPVILAGVCGIATFAVCLAVSFGFALALLLGIFTAAIAGRAIQ